MAGRLAEEVGRGLSSMSESEVQRSMTASDIFRPAAASAPPVGATARRREQKSATKPIKTEGSRRNVTGTRALLAASIKETRLRCTV